jgi:uncharacterized membrane protein YphA (DoxX/SURF4 family)
MTSFFRIVRILLGLIFIVASVDKIFDPMGFAGIVYNYQILPDSFISPVVIALPWLEFVCGALLITGVMTRASSFIVSLMLFVFIAALAYNSSRGLDIACGCFSTDAEATESITTLLVRDAVFLVMSLLTFISSSRIKN